MTKEERHEIYKGALEVFNPAYGICWAINEYYSISESTLWPFGHLSELPEIWEQRTHEMYYCFPYWFPLTAEGAEKRKQILLNAIEATKI